MSKVEDNLNVITGVSENVPAIIDAQSTAVAEVIEPPTVNHADVDEDYQKSRKTFHSLIEQGQDALTHLLEIAKESEHPRAFEVVASLLKNISDVNKELLDTHRRMKDIRAKSGVKVLDGSPQAGSINVDKAVFIGSTSDVLDKIKSEKH